AKRGFAQPASPSSSFFRKAARYCDPRFTASFYSTALKTLISVSTVILLGLIFAYHALEVQVCITRVTERGIWRERMFK
ncbi:Small conductance calcium-activated potassium channel protein, partial [Ooceraea biroi]